LRYAELLDRVPRRGQKIMASVLGAPRWTRWALGAGGVFLVAAAASALALGHDRREAESKASAPTATANSITPTQAVTSDQPQAVETRLVTLYTEPRGVNVWRFSRFVGTTPLPLEVQRGHSLRVRLSTPGFETQTLDLSADEGTRMVKLERSRSAAHAPAAEGPTLTQRERTRPAKKQHRATAPEKPAADPAPPAYEKF
jgi:hypothetical protein